jgi:hypothetical protein
VRNGRIPRGSNAALTLLRSIDVGLDASVQPGLHDWAFIQSTLQHRWLPLLRRVSEALGLLRISHVRGQVEGLEDRSVADRVVVLTSFVEAHRYAQHHIPFYLGEEEWAESPEEFLILEESNAVVAAALALLGEISVDSFRLHVSRQAARMVLCMQEDMISHFIEEGILSSDNAEHFLSLIHKDKHKLHNTRILPPTSTATATSATAAATAATIAIDTRGTS